MRQPLLPIILALITSPTDPTPRAKPAVNCGMPDRPLYRRLSSPLAQGAASSTSPALQNHHEIRCSGACSPPRLPVVIARGVHAASLLLQLAPRDYPRNSISRLAPLTTLLALRPAFGPPLLRHTAVCLYACHPSRSLRGPAVHCRQRPPWCIPPPSLHARRAPVLGSSAGTSQLDDHSPFPYSWLTDKPHGQPARQKWDI